ncbi:MAG: hypothetical protein LBU61_04380, partial [Coriobacteriales bacterium]|nr:hypothetical protein [Coriobacteriales bacterium]
TFGGSGQLTAVGGDSPGGDSFGIAIVNSAAADPRITIIGSTIIATGGNNTAVSAGIVCPGLGLYGSCDVTATGGNATTSSGVVCSNIGLVEGSLSASADPAASDSVGIRCSYQLSFAAGTLEAKGATSAISLPTDITSFINAALAYSWLTNSTPVNPGGVGTLYPESAAYVHSNNSKYVKLESRDSDFVYGLIFDADSSSTTYGKFFLDTDFSGTLSYHDVEYIPEAGTTEWNSTYATLTLTNFNWSTTTPVALTIVGDNLTINLPDGTASSFISTYDGASDTAGILADDLSYLFLSGTGSLTATGGDSTDGNSFGIVLVNNTRLDQRITVLGSTITATGGKASEVSAGISSPSLGLFGMHTVTATGGNAPTSIGLSCLDLGISSGNLTAYGDLSADESYGIKCGQLNYVAGSLEAVGATSAVSLPVNTNSFVNQAVAYSWWVNNSPTAPGGAGTLYFPTGTAEAYVYNSDQKFIRLVSLRIAIVDDITVAGTVGLPLSADQTATINLYGDTVKDSGVEEIASWFNINSLPAGITATANLEADADTITVSFTGIPSAAANIAFSITIPGSRLNGGSDITVLFNPNARFDIRPSDQASDLTFTYSTTFDIPASILYAPIKDIDVSVGVSGGEKPYKYLAVGLPNGIFINGTTGVIYGIPVTAAGPGSAMIIVIDDTGASQGITINFGAVTFDTSIPDWLLPFLPPGGNWTIPFTGDALGIVLSVVTGLTLITGLFVILARKRQGQESGRHSR